MGYVRTRQKLFNYLDSDAIIDNYRSLVLVYKFTYISKYNNSLADCRRKYKELMDAALVYAKIYKGDMRTANQHHDHCHT